MKLKFKLSLMVIAIVAVIVTGITVLLLQEASSISRTMSLEYFGALNDEQAVYWKGREDGHIRALRTVASMMENYERMPAETRREQFNMMLESKLLANCCKVGR